jgi:suppressor of G2 allele of SKP1
MSTKVEIKLKKVEGVHWPTLEANAQQLDARRAEALKKRNCISSLFSRIIVKFIFDLYLIAAYPTSSKNPKNWDKIVADVDAEEKDEKLEGDAALNKYV